MFIEILFAWIGFSSRCEQIFVGAIISGFEAILGFIHGFFCHCNLWNEIYGDMITCTDFLWCDPPRSKYVQWLQTAPSWRVVGLAFSLIFAATVLCWMLYLCINRKQFKQRLKEAKNEEDRLITFIAAS